MCGGCFSDFSEVTPGLGEVRMMKMGLFELGIYRLSGGGKRRADKKGEVAYFPLEVFKPLHLLMAPGESF